MVLMWRIKGQPYYQTRITGPKDKVRIEGFTFYAEETGHIVPTMRDLEPAILVTDFTVYVPG